MSTTKKIIIAVVVFILLLGLFLITFPNYNEGGNKSIFSTEEVQKADHKEAEEMDEKEAHATNQVPATATEEQNTLQYTLTFTAFKTPEKVGVPGNFDQISLQNLQTNDTISKALTGSEFAIETKSVNTHDATNTRDAKLRKFFFEKLNSPQIVGKFNSFENGKANISISMNGRRKDFSFPYTESPNALSINGKVDIVTDFQANAALASIAEACKELHLNKTWSEVDLKIEFKK